MNIFSKLWIVARTIKWRLLWNRRDTRYRFAVPGNPKFMSPLEAVNLLRDGDVCMVPGLAGNQRVSILSWAIREVFEKTGHPGNLTIISPGGHGGRGRAPGTLEELGQDGLVTRFFAGHLETYKAFLNLCERGKMEVHCIPQGILALLVDAMARGEDSLVSATGVGTFCDPRVGSGSALFDPKATPYIAAEGENLRYRIPKIDVAMFNAPAADREGNIYIRGCSMYCATKELALAVKRGGGRVIANVGKIVDKKEDEIFLAADHVDSVVVYPRTEQTVTFYHRRPSPYFMVGSGADTEKGIETARLMNRIFGLTPKRGDVASAVARMAAQLMVRTLPPESSVNIGTGMPEEVFYILYRQGALEGITAFTEAGAVGGVPAPGVFFGAAITPQEIVSSPEIFKRAYRNLDGTVLGMLEADSLGNVNVSKRGEGPMNYVGPGGFIDFTCAARHIFFVGSWMMHGRTAIRDGRITIIKRGKPKFTAAVDEITFNGAQALKAGKKVFYATDVGIFHLTARGMELAAVMPGIDVGKDILEFSPMKVVVPENVPVVDRSVVTGRGFSLKSPGR